MYKKELGRVARLGAEPNGPRPSFELTRENQKEKATPRALQCSLIYGPDAHTQSYTRYHNTINSSSNSPLTESYWLRSKSRGATNVSATSALRCFIFFEPRGQVDLVSSLACCITVTNFGTHSCITFRTFLRVPVNLFPLMYVQPCANASRDIVRTGIQFQRIRKHVEKSRICIITMYIPARVLSIFPLSFLFLALCSLPRSLQRYAIKIAVQ